MNNKKIYLELALKINKDMYLDSYITYLTFKKTEENLLEKLKDIGTL